MLIPGYSLEEPQCEVEYLRRKLGVIWTATPSDQIREVVESRWNQHLRTLVIASDHGAYLELLRKLPDDSVVLLVMSDEHYARAALELAQNDAVSWTFRNYGLDLLPSRSYFRRLLSAVGDTNQTRIPRRKVLEAIRRGVRVRRSIRKWRKYGLERVTVFPLGYTEIFAKLFAEERGITDPNMSLLDHRGASGESGRTLQVAFSGALGQWQRVTALDRASNTPNSLIRTVTGLWNGHGLLGRHNSVEYSWILRNSRFALCPPGYTSNESFRLMEAVLYGSLPIILESCVTQGTRIDAYLGGALASSAWRECLHLGTSMSEDARQIRLEVVRTGLSANLDQVREKLRELLVPC